MKLSKRILKVNQKQLWSKHWGYFCQEECNCAKLDELDEENKEKLLAKLSKDNIVTLDDKNIYKLSPKGLVHYYEVIRAKTKIMNFAKEDYL